jgi:uncharacterized protein YbjQ (UPF0145 family)
VSEDLRGAIAALASPPSSGTRSVTSDLSVDESLLLHGAGFEPADLVTATSVQSIPYGSFMIPYGQGAPVAIPYATQAVVEAFRVSAERLRRECAQAGGAGIVGVEVEVEIERQSAMVVFTGTAIRPIKPAHSVQGRPFVTDLSVRDFILLLRAGWEPLDIAAGASFVGSPLRGLRQVVAQTSQNVELTNLSQALQNTREEAMETMQRGAISANASGVVDVSIMDGPLGHSRHILAFICYGTAVRLTADKHQRIEPELVLPVDDDDLGFEATSLR